MENIDNEKDQPQEQPPVSKSVTFLVTPMSSTPASQPVRLTKEEVGKLTANEQAAYFAARMVAYYNSPEPEDN